MCLPLTALKSKQVDVQREGGVFLGKLTFELHYLSLKGLLEEKICHSIAKLGLTLHNLGILRVQLAPKGNVLGFKFGKQAFEFAGALICGFLFLVCVRGCEVSWTLASSSRRPWRAFFLTSRSAIYKSCTSQPTDTMHLMLMEVLILYGYRSTWLSST